MKARATDRPVKALPRLKKKEAEMLIRAINHFGSRWADGRPTHPWATPSNVQRFDARYAARCLQASLPTARRPALRRAAIRLLVKIQ